MGICKRRGHKIEKEQVLIPNAGIFNKETCSRCGELIGYFRASLSDEEVKKLKEEIK